MTKDAQGGNRLPQHAPKKTKKSDDSVSIKTARDRATERTATKKAQLLNAYRELGNLTHAARAAGIHRDSHYGWLATDPVYAVEFAKAQEPAAQTLEDEAIRRAVSGVDEPVFHGGQLCYAPSDLRYARDQYTGNGKHRRLKAGAILTPKPGAKALSIRRYSDTLLIFLLKGAKPEKYKDRSTAEISSPTGKPIKSEMRIRFIRPPAASK